MNENIVELLLYLFENYIYDNESNELDKEEIHQGLSHAGFTSLSINNAFSWLEELKNDVSSFQNMHFSSESYRIFSAKELMKI
jgi:Smg protein